MKLKDFMDKRKLKVADLALMFRVSPMSVYRYLKGELPASTVMARIVHETGGLVGISDLIPEDTSTIQDTGTQG